MLEPATTYEPIVKFSYVENTKKDVMVKYHNI